MDSSYWNQDKSAKSAYSNSNSFENKIVIHSKNIFNNKTPKKNHLIKNSDIFDKNYKKQDFNYLVKYAHQYLLSFYRFEEEDYNIRMIEHILDNEDTHLVAEFKDFLIMGDINEFLQTYYEISDSKRYLPKICEYYLKSSMIFPNYVSLEENKYIYKNIRKKQKLIDNQQEQDDIKEQHKKGKLMTESNDDFFSSKTLNSILQQTNTSNVKLIFGIENNNVNNKKENKNIDEDETPHKIIENLDEIEKEINENKNKLKKEPKEKLNKNNSCGKIENNSNSNNKFKKYIYIKERNKNLNLLNINNNKTGPNISASLYKKNYSKKRVINNYLSKNQVKTENNSKNYIKSNSSLTGKESDYIQKKYINYFMVNSQKNNKRKLLIDSSLNKNKSIFNTQINTLIPTKASISKFFINNYYSRSVLKNNTFNFITKNIENKNSQNFPFSPSLHTLQVNPLKKKYYYNLNININNSNSARNLNNNQIMNSNSNSNEHKNNKDKEKIKKNNNKHKNRNLINSLNINKRHNHTVSLTINILNYKDKNKIKQKYNTEKNNDNKSQTKNLRTIGNNKNNNKMTLEKLINSNQFKKIINKNTKSNKNTNHIKIETLNLQKINSLSNIKKATNSTNKKNKITFLNRNSGKNIFKNKVFPVSPLSVKLNQNKSPSYEKTLNTKPKKNKNNIYQNLIMNNNIMSKNKQYFRDSIINSPKNKPQQVFNNCIKNQLILEELNKKKNIILPFNKEINIINININECNNTEKGSMTSRNSKNKSKKKLKEYKGRNKAEINFYNQEIKSKFKNKKEAKINNNNNNLISRNEKNNPIIVKNLNNDNFRKTAYFEKDPNAGFFTSRK